MGQCGRVRSRFCIALILAGTTACASPLAALPLAAAAAKGPQALSAPTEDGTVYVLAEGTRFTSNATLRSMWKREASKACQGDYLVLSERAATSTRGGVVGGRSHEGFVQCVSAEGMGFDAPRRARR